VNACYGDTSYFLALLVPGDANHEAAQRIALTLNRPIITSDFIIIEVGNFLSGVSARQRFTTFIHALRQDQQTSIVPASNKLVIAGIELYLHRPDKAWSLTDCISFEIMREHGIHDALTADKHFEQAGFGVMLKPNVK